MIQFICPICGENLTKKDKYYTCNKNHSFDIAKEGYVNLLPIKSKKSKNPGDNLDMITARRTFLQSGHYEKLGLNLVSVIESLGLGKNSSILDLGCGEGYYTSLIKSKLPTNNDFLGVDISKVAVKYASKRFKDIEFCVASSFELPIADNSLNLIIRNYAPSLDSELIRIIKEGGYFLTITPGPRHLYQLRELIYTDVIEHPISNNAPVGFSKLSHNNLKYKINISNKDNLLSLVQMTPFAWKFNKEIINKLLLKKEWDIECDFNIELYKNNS